MVDTTAAAAALTPHELDRIDALLYEDGSKELVKHDDVRAKRTAGERASRLRRQANVRQMEEQVHALEFVLANYDAITAPAEQLQLRLQQDDSSATAVVAATTARVRGYLAKSLELDRHAASLHAQRAQLQRSLREHALAHKLLSSWLTPTPSLPPQEPKKKQKSAWELDIELWNTQCDLHFAPWSLDDCVNVLKLSLQKIHEFSKSNDFISSGQEFMGWSDRRCVDHVTSTLQFNFAKCFAHCDAQRLFDKYWEMHFSADQLCRNMLGWSNKMHVQLIQHVTEDLVIFRRDVQYPGIETCFHTVYLMFRVKTPTGFLHCIRTIPAPALQAEMEVSDGGGAGGWMNNFHWTNMDFVDGGGCKVSFGGLISSKSIQFANRWMLELAMTLVRAESSFVSPLFLTSG